MPKERTTNPLLTTALPCRASRKPLGFFWRSKSYRTHSLGRVKTRGLDVTLGAEPFLCSVENTWRGAWRAGQVAQPLPLRLFSQIVFIGCSPWIFLRGDLLTGLWRGGQQTLRGADSPSPTPVVTFANGVLSSLGRTADFPGACLLKQNPLQAGTVCAAAPKEQKASLRCLHPDLNLWD